MQEQTISEEKIKGYKCPCCEQFVKVYCRKINSSMARVLMLIYNSGKRDFFHVENWLKEIGKPELRADFHKLRFWSLLEKKIEDREDGSNRNGYYKLTGRGIMFAENKVTAAKNVYIFNNKVLGFNGESVNIIQALGDKFSYDELMKPLQQKQSTVIINNGNGGNNVFQNDLFNQQ